jgi:glutamyl-tRNA synthetase
MTQTIRTRFAPSPTGDLHIGSARTALFNYFFAKATGGQFLIRIEDTDQLRSTPEALEAIQKGLDWLNIIPDEAATFQSAQKDRHQSVAHTLLESGKAYKCYCTAEELAIARAEAEAQGTFYKYDRRWRDADPQAPAPQDNAGNPLPFAIRLKAPLTGQVSVDDGVMGHTTVEADTLDDMILLRSDGTPTYMLSVVVDDYDMGITHVIRGDDHFTNTFRQKLLFEAFGWPVPSYYHVPLIHDEDGKKLSKRRGATSVFDYKDDGIVWEAMVNYLVRLGWSHGDQELFSVDELCQIFGPKGFGKSPSQLDMKKLRHINAHYLRHHLTAASLMDLMGIENPFRETVERILPQALDRSETIIDLKEQVAFCLEAPNVAALSEMLTPEVLGRLTVMHKALMDHDDWSNPDLITAVVKAVISDLGIKFPLMGKPLRAVLAGGSLSVGHVIWALGKDEATSRLIRVIKDSSHE